MSTPCLNKSLPPSAGGPALTIRILIADDHDIVCAGLERMIADQNDMEICGVASSGAEAAEKALELQPDIALLDMNMSGMNGLECTRKIRKEIPDCEVALFTGLETDELMRQAFACGAKSFILKTDARDHLLEALRALARHKPYFTSKVSKVIFSQIMRRRTQEAATPQGRLTVHEIDIVRRLALGDSNRELAEKLGVNLRTAEGHRAAVMRKMDFESLAALVRYAVRNGLIEI